MSRRLVTLSALLLILAGSTAHAERDWTQLKLGMTAEETLGTLGRPMLKSKGKGFEVWIYDNGAEAVMYGTLIGWTTPAAATAMSATSPTGIATPPTASERSTDIWSADESGETYPTFLSLLPRPAAPVAAPAPARPATPPGGRRDDVWLPYYTLRRL